MSKKNELPKGFRMTKRVREILLPRLCYEKFHVKIDRMLVREKHLFHKVMDYLCPDEASAQVKDVLDSLPMRPQLEKVQRLSFKGIKRGNAYRGHYSYNTDCLGLGSSIPKHAEERMTCWQRTQGDDDKRTDAALSWPVTPEKSMVRYGKPYPSAHGSFNNLEVPMSAMPPRLRREVAEFLNEVVAFEEEYTRFYSDAQQVVNGIRSTKQLKEFNPKVYIVLADIADKIRPPCSDVTLADVSLAVERQLL